MTQASLVSITHTADANAIVPYINSPAPLTSIAILTDQIQKLRDAGFTVTVLQNTYDPIFDHNTELSNKEFNKALNMLLAEVCLAIFTATSTEFTSAQLNEIVTAIAALTSLEDVLTYVATLQTLYGPFNTTLSHIKTQLTAILSLEAAALTPPSV